MIERFLAREKFNENTTSGSTQQSHALPDPGKPLVLGGRLSPH
jgi:hypothetical protein